MSTSRPKIQLELALSPACPGEPADGGEQGFGVPTAKHSAEIPAKSSELMEEIIERGNLKKALKRVQANKGGSGDRRHHGR